jgi:hypothetical protein
MKELLTQLREQPEFRQIMDGIKEGRPIVPEYQPCKTMDETAFLVEKIKFESARRTGWDLLYQALTGQRP